MPPRHDRRALLLAMSGVRVVNAELRALGLTLPGFVDRGQVIASLPSLGLLTVAAHSPPHWEVVYRELDAVSPADVAALERERFDLVAISSLTARIDDAYAVADRLRAGGTVVVLGGLHATALPDEALGHADAVIQGDGERLWPELLADLERGALRPLYSSLRDPSRAHRLEEARVPRYDLLEPAAYDRIPLQTTRGCPRACAFCGASRLLGPYRVKPMEQVRRELERIVERWPRPFVELADDNTFLTGGWSRALAALLGEHGVRWFTETDLSIADDEPLLERLARSGCAQLLVGLESPAAAPLRGIDPAGWKARQSASAVERVRRIQAHGIAVNGCFVLGLDGDDAGAFDRVAAFVEEAGLCDVQITIQTPFPGTALAERLRAEGRLLRDRYWDACTLFDVTYRPLGMEVAELEARFRDLMARLYAPEPTGRRRARWRALHRETRAARGAP